MNRRALGAARVVVFAAVAVLVGTCSDSPISPLPDVGGPLFAVSDGGVSGGNEDVFFLPPLVESPRGPRFGDRAANPNLAPIARICRLNATEAEASPGGGLACVATVVDLAMTYSATGEFYQRNWKTSDPAEGAPLDNDSHYRIEIFVGTVALAFRDVDPDPGPATSSCKRSNLFCQFQNGSNLPIKVRIETGAVCLELGGDPNVCATANLAEGGLLTLQQNNLDVGIARLDDAGGSSATINMQLCTDLRDRASKSVGRIDLRTFGDCVEIATLEALLVVGTATL